MTAGSVYGGHAASSVSACGHERRKGFACLENAPGTCLHAGASAKYVGMVPATRPVSSTSTTLAAPDPVPDAGAPAKRAALAPGSFMKYMSEQSHSSGERLSDVEAMAQARPTRRRSAGAGCKCGCSMLACARAAAALLK